jgi:hypothetical protein
MTAHMGRVDPPRVVNIADLRDVAKKRLPQVVFDYIDGGADAEWTMRENARVFDDVMSTHTPKPFELMKKGIGLYEPTPLSPKWSSARSGRTYPR